MTHPFVAPLIGALLMAAACSRPGAVPTAGVTDSAGVRIVRLADLDQEVFPAWSSQLVFSTESQDSLLLGPNVDAGFTTDSSLWVTAGSEVVVLDRLGRLQRRVGRSGDGPGEFRLAFRLGISADGTPFVSDFSGRLSQFAADGRLTRSIASLARGGDAQVDPISMLADGRLLATTWQQRPNKPATPGVPVGTIVRDSAPLMVLDSAGQPIERLGLWAGAERALLDVGGEPGFLLLPFSRTALYDGRGAMAVVGSTDSLDLSLFEGTKLALRLIARPASGRFVVGEDLSPGGRRRTARREAPGRRRSGGGRGREHLGGQLSHSAGRSPPLAGILAHRAAPWSARAADRVQSADARIGGVARRVWGSGCGATGDSERRERGRGQGDRPALMPSSDNVASARIPEVYPPIGVIRFGAATTILPY